MGNLDAVQRIYQSFSTGDLDGILEQLADDVSWDEFEDPSEARLRVPYLIPRSGKDEVRRFFEVLAELIVPTRFELGTPIADGASVVMPVVAAWNCPSTGKSMSDEELHHWEFDDSGKVSRFHHYIDPGKHLAMITAEAAATV